ncbi:hypothetical protein H9Y04_12015 [Streptomyces sp. TRM66268-LWL]|uniref:SWIM-type domain-containing protein n=1 Tax=Streptomyces polyasparticus TaxID=2767826 RepID=A0ABR7SE85_9ACTN|nr:hypothetical protein [Streptomyces polyasparticus]MBC9713294.1 hypothetical protein [Streptomyces polyasparticus]
MSPQLPPVAPSVTAELVGALTPRLRKRLDAAVAKLADRAVVVEGDTVRIALDDDTELQLHAPGGQVTTADGIRCGCLLAPACLHRAAAASAAPIAQDDAPAQGATPEDDVPVQGDTSEDDVPVQEATPEGDDPAQEPTPGQLAAAQALHAAAAAVLEAGTDGAGAVLQAELLRAAHTARLAGLPRAAASAVSVVSALRAARSADPAYRLADLVTALHTLLFGAHRLPYATGPELSTLQGAVRQPYASEGSLRLYGLFSEPVLTATGYAGAVTWTADADGRLYTVADVAPGGAGRAVGAGDRAIRVGDTALTPRELSRAGLALTGATVSPTGRLGAGAGVRAVRAPGADWSAEPLDRLWAVPVAEQATRALSDDGHDLLFLDITVIGPVREAAGDCLLADCGGLTLRLDAAHDDPALPCRDNLRLLAALSGRRLRVIARLVPGPLPRVRLLASSHPADPGARLDLGLDRMLRADLPAGTAAPIDRAPVADEAPLHLLRRRVQQAAAGGRRVLAFPGDATADIHRLRRLGLTTAGDLLDALHAAAADRSRDAFGRLMMADADRFARSWLAAAHYTAEVDRALCAAAWGSDGEAV